MHQSQTHQRCQVMAGVLVALGLAGCATPLSTPDSWTVAPIYRVSNAGAGAGYAALARRLEGEQRWQEARDAWGKAAAAEPQDADVLNRLGMAEAGLGRFGDAVSAFRRAVALAPQRVALLNNLGYALLLDGRSEEARGVLRELLARNPDHLLARANLERIDALTPAPTQAQAQAQVEPTPVPADAAVANALPAAAQASAEASAEASVAPGQVPRAEARVQTQPNVAPLTVGLPSLPVMARADAAQPVAPSGAASEVSLPYVAPMPVASAMPVAGAVPVASAAVDAQPDREALAVRVEIANGNGVTGMAARVGGWLRTRGVTSAVRLSNVRPFTMTTSVVHYRAGYAEAAQTVANRLPRRVAIAAAAGGALNADVRVVLGHDVRSTFACLPGCSGEGMTAQESAARVLLASVWPIATP